MTSCLSPKLSNKRKAAGDRMNGKYFVVTGGTQGLGEAICRLLAEEGASGIVLNGRDSDKGTACQKALAKAFPDTKFVYVKADMAKVEDCTATVKACEDHFGAIHGVVNCAALTSRGTLDNTSVDLFDRMMAINVRAPFFIMQAAVKLMKKNKNPGSIVNISSLSSYGGQTFLCAYATSKGALNTLTKNVAFQLNKDKIRCNALCLGWMNTPGEHVIQTTEDKKEANWLEAADSSQPMGRILRPDEVARMAVNLLSDDTEMMTGACVDFGIQMPIGCTA